MKLMQKAVVLVCFLLVSTLPSSDVNGQSNIFKFLVISDVHISNDTVKDVKLKRFVSEINNIEFGKVDFLILTGDNVSSYFSDRKKPNDIKNNRSLKLVSILKNLKIPYYLCLGNHDYKIDRDKDSDAPFSKAEIDTMEILWNKSTGIEPFYSFEHKGWKFIFLNSMRGRYLNRAFDDNQMKMLADQLSDGKASFLFFHYPVQTDHFRIWAKPIDLITQDNEPEFFSILQKHKNTVKAIFVGHGHMWNDDVLYGSINEYETTTFGEKKAQSFNIVEVDKSNNSFKVTPSEK